MYNPSFLTPMSPCDLQSRKLKYFVPEIIKDDISCPFSVTISTRHFQTTCHVYLGQNHRAQAVILIIHKHLLFEPLRHLSSHSFRSPRSPRRFLLSEPDVRRSITTTPSRWSEPADSRLFISRRFCSVGSARLTISIAISGLVGRSMLWNWCHLFDCVDSGRCLGLTGGIEAIEWTAT